MIPLPPEPARGQDILTWARGVQRVLRALRPQPGAGIRIAEGPNSFTISADTPRGGASAARPHPFQVITRPKPGSPSQLQAGVVYHSSLYLSLRPNHKYPITGLLNEAQTSGWFDLIPNDAIWLGITFDDNGQPNWAGIDSWGQGNSFQLNANAWSGNNSYCEDNGDEENPRHQTSRKLIAYTTPGADGKPVVTQVIFRDQILRNVCIDGRPARYPFDHEGGYPL